MSAPLGLPLYFQSGDDPELYTYAARIGFAIAEGSLLDVALGQRTLKVLAGGGEINSLGMRLCWWLTDCRLYRQQQLNEADWAIRNAARPLFQARATKAAVEEAAARANGERLKWEWVFRILRDERLRTRSRRAAA